VHFVCMVVIGYTCSQGREALALMQLGGTAAYRLYSYVAVLAKLSRTQQAVLLC
jgi:hypothetical protein